MPVTMCFWGSIGSTATEMTAIVLAESASCCRSVSAEVEAVDPRRIGMSESLVQTAGALQLHPHAAPRRRVRRRAYSRSDGV